jgi:hypothetical protein
MKHISEIMLEITQLQLRLQEQLISNRDLLVELGGSPVSIDSLATITKAEDDFFSISVLSAQINTSINAVGLR